MGSSWYADMTRLNTCPKRGCRGFTTHSRLIHWLPFLARLITRPRFADGGLVRPLAVSGDSLPARLSGGAYFVKDEQVRHWYSEGGYLPEGHRAVSHDEAVRYGLTPYINRNYGEDEGI